MCQQFAMTRPRASRSSSHRDEQWEGCWVSQGVLGHRIRRRERPDSGDRQRGRFRLPKCFTVGPPPAAGSDQERPRLTGEVASAIGERSHFPSAKEEAEARVAPTADALQRSPQCQSRGNSGPRTESDTLCWGRGIGWKPADAKRERGNLSAKAGSTASRPRSAMP